MLKKKKSPSAPLRPVKDGTSKGLRKDKEKPKTKYILAVGRRKRSVARVKLYQGKGQIMINGKPADEYFVGRTAKVEYLRPLELVGGVGKYYATAKINGGGKSSQLGAFIHGISRTLTEADKNNRAVLKKSLFLRRDPREKERRKPGNAGKARKKKQSPKR